MFGDLEAAREGYALGNLTILQLEHRLDVALGLRPKVDVCIGVSSCCGKRHILGVLDCDKSARIKDEYGISW